MKQSGIQDPPQATEDTAENTDTSATITNTRLLQTRIKSLQGRVRGLIAEHQIPKPLDWLFLAASLTIVARTLLIPVPEIIPLGSAIGEIVFTVAIGYVVSYIFHWIVVRAPENRRRRAILGSVGILLGRYARSPRDFVRDLSKREGSQPEIPDEPDLDYLKRILSEIDVNHVSPHVVGYQQQLIPIAWRQKMLMRISEFEHSFERLEPLLPQLDNEMLALTLKLDQTIRIYPWRSVLEHGYIGVPTAFADEIYKLWITGEDLYRRYEEAVGPLVTAAMRNRLRHQHRPDSDISIRFVIL
ncbi:hypothetical protein [Hoyosella altamirensis]|uniref:Uncharacterized protein n=1 Tax=Hoyosella altamirensis TaxID=616997 RepID=A0A839RV27_9ACTN|nr:hypothetical protein [Hoyosella altamirensis]MBB3040167.1 hypothetical protein [Hoyosella altamirensis]